MRLGEGSSVGFHLGPAEEETHAAASAAASLVLGKRHGIVRRCVELPWDEGSPRVHTAVAQGARHIPGWWFRDPPDGTGISMDPELARLAAIAEAVERYCSMAPPHPSLLERACFRELGSGAAIPPRNFARLSARQYRRFPTLAPLTEDKVVEWSWSFSLTRRRLALVPAALVYFSRGRRSPNNFSAEMVSSGFACHVCLHHATLTGLCEVFERDALTIAWHNRLPLTPLDPRGTAVEELLNGPLADVGLEFQIFKVPSDGPFPVVLGLGVRSDGQPHVVAGAACRPDPVAAATKALFEVCQVLRRFRGRTVDRPARFTELDDHATFYATAEGAALLHRHLPTGPRMRLDAVDDCSTGAAAADLDLAVKSLDALGLEVLVSDVTTADVAQTGFRVVRVLVPGTIDMSADARFAQLGTPRLYHVPVSLGLRKRALSERQLNRLPVPLA